MNGTDHLRAARAAMQAYREESPCGFCREDADAVIDMLDKDIEFETLAGEIVRREAAHPKATLVPERARQLASARDEAARRLGAAPARPAERPRIVGSLVGIAQRWRGDLGEMVPRPFGVRPEARRNRP